MRIRALLQFRLSRAQLAAALPGPLRWIAETARDEGPSFSQAEVDIGQDPLDELLRWGRVRAGEVTRLRMARLSHAWTRDELGQGLVEIETPRDREPPELVNPERALVARWSCACCDRIDLEQVGPLEVQDLDPGTDLQVTDTRHVLLAARLRGIAEQQGAATRPLAGTVQAVQLVTPPSIQVAPVFPLVRVGEPCSCCGRQTFDRSDRVEGSLSTDGATGLVVAQEWPLTVEPTVLVAGQSAEPLGWRGRVSREPIHQEGRALDPAQLRTFRSGIRPAFVSLTLRDALAAAGARLPPLRPVRSARDA